MLIKKNKFYFDNYDQYTGIFDKTNFIKRNLELNLINKADLVVSRGLELNHLKIKIRKIYFFPIMLIKIIIQSIKIKKILTL